MIRDFHIKEIITSREEGSTMALLADIGRYTVPTMEEEVELASRIKNGDEAALNELVERNLRFVVSVAKQYQGYGLTLGDLVDEGAVGLIEAAKRFDVTRGFKFCSYAVWWIIQSIQKAIGENGNAIRVPSSQRVNMGLLKNIRNTFELQNEREPTNEELAELADIDIEKIDKLFAIPQCNTSLDMSIGEDENSTFNDLVAGESRADDTVEKESLKNDIKRALGVLKKRQREVLELFFGLNDKRECSLDEIADMMNLSRERTRQIKEEALRIIRKNVAAKAVLKDYAA